ncbi:MAG: DUF4864 domain-containing protein [Rhodobacteraceae bacterium]|nr:DUF4864 domain-containing protein [Paracoccaceae bacterium]
MARIFGIFLLVLGLSGPASAEPAGIQATINGQMEAFRADDFDRAFSFAAPNIKGMFGDAERFGSMVRNGYPMVWKNQNVRYLELRELGGRLWQMVQIEDQDGSFHYLDYLMIETQNGWQIGAVQYLPEPGVGA